MKLTDSQKKAGDILKRIIEAAKEKRKRFMETGREIMRYGFSPDYNFEYTKSLSNAFFKAKVAKTAEAIQIFVPSIVRDQPRRLVNARGDLSPEREAMADIVGKLLNYTPAETGLVPQNRNATQEAIAYGRGVMATGKHPRKNLICSEFFSVRDLLVDSNAAMLTDANWMSRRRVRPRWEVIKEYPKAREILADTSMVPVYATKDSDADSKYEWEKSDSTSECICYYEVHLRCGLHHFQGGSELLKAIAAEGGQPLSADEAKGAQYDADDSPLKYCVTEGGVLFHVGEWDVPFFMDDEFPYTLLDFYGNPDSIWPVSVLEPGLGYQRMMNFIVTLLMGKYKRMSTTLGAKIKQGRQGLDDKAKDKILRGVDGFEWLEIDAQNAPGDKVSLDQFVQQWDWNHNYLDYGLKFLSSIETLYEKATGLNELLYGINSGPADRSAEATRVRDRNSKVRLEDMHESYERFQTKLARKEALAWRFLQKREDIKPILGEAAAQQWGFLISPDRNDANLQAQELMQSGVPPQEAMQMAQEHLAQAVSLENWVLETEYTVEHGSARRRDLDQQIDVLREVMQTSVPAQLQSMNPPERALAYDTQAALYEALGVKPELVEKYKMMAQQLLQAPPPMIGPDGAPLPPAPPAPPGPPA
jgi:hypothetical protein